MFVNESRGWADDLNVRVGDDRRPLSDEKVDSIYWADCERAARADREKTRQLAFDAEVERRVHDELVLDEVLRRLPADVRGRLYPRPAVHVVSSRHGSDGGSGDGLLPFLAGAAAADLWRAML